MSASRFCFTFKKPFLENFQNMFQVRCAIWYQTLKNGVLTVGQNAVLTSQNALEQLSQKSVSVNQFLWHSNFYLMFNHSHGMYMALEWHSKREKFELFPCYKNCYINFSVLKTDDEIKVKRRIFTCKTLIYDTVCNI